MRTIFRLNLGPIVEVQSPGPDTTSCPKDITMEIMEFLFVIDYYDYRQ